MEDHDDIAMEDLIHKLRILTIEVESHQEYLVNRMKKMVIRTEPVSLEEVHKVREKRASHKRYIIPRETSLFRPLDFFSSSVSCIDMARLTRNKM